MTSGCDQVDRGYSMEARPFPDRRFSERSHLALSGVLSTLCPLEALDQEQGSNVREANCGDNEQRSDPKPNFEEPRGGRP